MDRQRWSRAKSVFLSASRLPPFARRGWVWFTCGRDTELRSMVLRLLDNATLRDSFLELEPDTTGPRLPVSQPASRTLPDLELQECIGQGGMGVVYKARQLSLDRIVAVKMLPDLLAVSESRRKAFENESRVVAGLKHPNIVPVFWSGRTEGSAYFVMEFVEGKSLDVLLADNRDAGESRAFLEPANVARFVARLANALQATHAHGVMHRDVKPGNVLVTRDGEPKLVDFGLARPLDRHSLTSRAVGTPHYMSPEQARVQDVHIDHRTDIYSLGVVMYEMLTLHRPFEGRTLAEILIAIRERDPVRVRKLNTAIPRDLETICHKAMRKRPDQRYETAADFEADLLAFLEHRSPRAQPPALFERVQAGIERHRVAAGVIALTAVLVPILRWLIAAEIERHRVAEAVAALPLEVEAARPGEPDADVEDRRLQAHQRTLESAAALRASADELSAEQLARLDEAEAVAHADLLRMRADVLARIERNVQAGMSDPAGTDLLIHASESALLARVLALESNARADHGLSELLLPQITLRTAPPGATVYARRLDPSTGISVDHDWTRVGTSDLISAPIAPGYYRLVAVGADGSYGELTQLVASDDMTRELPTIVLRPSTDVARDMVLIEASTYTPTPGERLHRNLPGTMPLGDKVHLAAFLVDAHEVTNALYRAFCEATARPMPARPSDAGPDWDAMPVAFIDVYAAEAYAAWAGERLLTAAEWRQSVRGTHDRTFPWKGTAADMDSILRRANLRGTDTAAAGADEAALPPGADTDAADLRRYLRHVRPVGSYPDGRSVEGVDDLIGNVAEWTTSISVNEVRDGLWRPEPGTHLVMGLSFTDAPAYFEASRLIHSESQSCDVGFRCGRTAPEEVPGGR